MTKVRFASWGAPTTDTSFIWTGVEKGFFKEENIDIEWVAGNGTADALRHVIAGDTQFAWSSADAVLFGAEQGAKVRQLFTFWGNIYEIMYLPDVCKCTIKSIGDLKGKKVGVQSQSSITRLILLQALARANMKESDFGQEINVGFNPAPPLLQGQIDTYTSWPNLTYYAKSLPGMSKAQVWPIENVVFPGDGLVVSDSTWQNNRPLVESFFRALVKSLKYEFAHEDEVAQFLGKYLPGSTEKPDTILPQVKNNDMQAQFKGTETNGLGYIDIESVRSAQDVFLANGIMKTKVDIGPLFTNELVTKYKDYK